MENLTITIHDAKTGKTITREMNSEELAQIEAQKNKLLQEQAEIEAKATARQSALDKLAALGLTEAEIQALAG